MPRDLLLCHHLNLEVKTSKVILNLINKKLINACHDVSDGGILVSILEMCMAKKIGFHFSKLSSSHKYLFGEDQGRYLVAIDEENTGKISSILNDNCIKYKKLGAFSNTNRLLIFPDKSSIKLNSIIKFRKAWEKKV